MCRYVWLYRYTFKQIYISRYIYLYIYTYTYVHVYVWVCVYFSDIIREKVCIATWNPGGLSSLLELSGAPAASSWQTSNIGYVHPPNMVWLFLKKGVP